MDYHKLIVDLSNIKFGNILNIGESTQKTSKRHHALIKSVLLDNKIQCVDINKKYIKTVLCKNEFIPLEDSYYYIEEINGKQNSPDFTLFRIINNKIVYLIHLEAKSGNKKIMWNDGYPSEDTLYLYTDTKLDKTILITGTDLLGYCDVDRYNRFITEIEQLKTKYKSRCGNSIKPIADINLYPRKCDSQYIDLTMLDPETVESININVHNMVQNSIVEIKESAQPVDEKYNLRGISLFAGAGGDTLGMIRAGVNVVGFVENQKDAISTHLANFPESKLIGSDIRNIPDADFKQYIGNIDIIFGGFPCQSFSHGGKKRANDPRGGLYKEFIRIANIIKPKMLIAENVKGILTRKNSDGGLIINTILNDFKEIGYDFIYKKIKCQDFGIPQNRERVIFTALHNSPLVLDIPITNNTIVPIRNICEFSLYNAIKIEKKKFLEIIPEFKSVMSDCSSVPSGKPPVNLVKCYNEEKDHGISFKKRLKSTWAGIEDLDSPSHTIISTYCRMPRLFIPMKNTTGTYLRAFNQIELQQLQGFPKDFVFKGNEASVITQIGNAVPPIVVTTIVNWLKCL